MAKKTQKTHSALKKIAKVKPNGTVKITKAGGNHKSGKKSNKITKKYAQSSLMSKGDYKRLKDIIK
jgi:ribosomal protein L35